MVHSDMCKRPILKTVKSIMPSVFSSQVAVPEGFLPVTPEKAESMIIGARFKEAL